jgi:hypothetical protein
LTNDPYEVFEHPSSRQLSQWAAKVNCGNTTRENMVMKTMCDVQVFVGVIVGRIRMGSLQREESMFIWKKIFFFKSTVAPT